MSSLDIICAEVSKVFEIDNYSVNGQLIFNDITDMNFADIAEFSSLISSTLPFQNCSFCYENDYLIIKKDDKYVIIYLSPNFPLKFINIKITRHN